MANTLRFKRGLVAGIPTAALGEPLFTTDTFDLYIGNGTGNTRFQKYIASGTTSQLLRGDGSLLTMPIVLTSPSNGEVLKYNGTNWVNSSDAGVTGSGTAGQVTYWGSSSTITGSNNLFWDATNNRLGIGTNTPTRALQVQGTGFFADSLQVQRDFIGATTIRVGNLGTIDASTIMQFALSEDGATVNGYFRRYRNGQGLTELGFSNALTFMGAVTGTPAERMRIFATGNIAVNSTTDNGLRFQVTGDGYFSGSVGIGVSSLTGYSVRIQKPMTGSTIVWGVQNTGIIQSDVTNSAFYYSTQTATQATTFTITNLYNYYANQSTFGAGSSVTNQYGFFAESTLIGATNNYGFYGNIASGTGRWNLYMNGTAANYLAGSLGIGVVSPTIRLQVENNENAGNGIFTRNTNSGNAATSFLTTQSNAGLLSLIAHSTTHAVWANTALISTSTGLTGGLITFVGAGNYDVWTNNTFRMRLDASGNLLVGGTSVYGATITSYATSGRSGGIGIRNSAGTVAGAFCSYAAGSGSGSTDILVESAGFMLFSAAGAERMRLTATNGNLHLGTFTSDSGERLQVNGTMRVSGALTVASTGYTQAVFNGTNTSDWGNHIGFQAQGTVFGYVGSVGSLLGNTTKDMTIWSTAGNGFRVYTNGNNLRLQIDSAGAATFSSSVTLGGSINLPNTGEYYLQNTASNTFIGLNFNTPYIRFGVGGTVRAFMNATGLGLGTSSPAYRLDVQGTLGVSGASTFGGLMTISGSATTLMQITSTGSAAYLGMGDSSGSVVYLGSDDGSFLVQTPGSSFSNKLVINSAGAATFSSSIQAGTAIAIGTTPDTNKPFKILKNINGTVGINFENTSTGSSAFSAIQMGTDVTGGTKFANLVYASSGVSASGVYQPDGTSLINNGSGGLNFLGTPIRFFTSTGNGTLRWLFDNEGAIQFTTTAPTTSATDGYKQYSADVVAGNAAPHFRTENGAVIKLYQETTGVGNAIFSQGGGNSVLDDSTFDGYTLRQIVKALRNQGILA